MSLWRPPFAAAFVALSLLVPAANAGNEAFLGKWNCVAVSPEGELPSVWVVTESAGVVAVAVEIEGSARPVQDVKLDGRNLTMKVTYQSVSYDVSVAFEGDTLAGTWTGEGQQGPIRGKRV
jgi:hypothetical protein